MKFSRFKNIYVLAPYNHATGGVELAHQLVDYLNKNNANAYIIYIDKITNKIVTGANITSAYSEYNIKLSDNIEDSEDNILILPEIYFEWIFIYTNIVIGCWWMSVDFRYTHCHWIEQLTFNQGIINKLRVIKRLLNSKCTETNTDKILREQGERIYHFYQSHYAQNHLYNRNFSHILPLKDYINTTYLSNIEDVRKRENIILYNPAKGLEFTKKIIEKSPNFRFIPLKGLSREELAYLLKRAKVYIDFGGFPGKDRLPREAAMNGLCVITGKFGAARFYEDIPIADQYKIDAKKTNIDQILKLISSIFNCFDTHTADFNYWRNQILKEREEFHAQIEDFFFRCDK